MFEGAGQPMVVEQAGRQAGRQALPQRPQECQAAAALQACCTLLLYSVLYSRPACLVCTHTVFPCSAKPYFSAVPNSISLQCAEVGIVDSGSGARPQGMSGL